MDIDDAYNLIFSSDNAFQVTLTPEDASDPSDSYTVDTPSVYSETSVSLNDKVIGRIELSSLGSDRVMLGNENVRPSGRIGAGRNTSREFKASDNITYAWKLVQGEGWNLRNRKTNELVATLRPWLKGETRTCLLSISQSHIELQNEIVLTIVYMEQRRRKRWDKGCSYQENFLMAVMWKSKEIQKAEMFQSVFTGPSIPLPFGAET